MSLTIIESQGVGKAPKILTQKEVQKRCPHVRKKVSSFSNKILVCELCNKFFDRYKK